MSASDPRPIVAIIQARMTSSRLPGKVLKPLGSATVIDSVINRVRAARGIDRICVAIPEGAAQDPLAASVARHSQVALVRGSEADVLGRYLVAARELGAGTIIRITADCPLIDPLVIGCVVGLYCSGDAHYASTALETGFPVGYDVEVLTREALETAGAEATDAYEREHVTAFLWRRPQRFPAHYLDRRPDARHWRLALDTPEDYALITAVHECLAPKNPLFGFADVVRLLEAEPALAGLNRDVLQTPLVGLVRT